MPGPTRRAPSAKPSPAPWPAEAARRKGKTHPAVALGIKAIEAGYGVYFVRAHALMEDLRRAQAEHRLDRHMRVYLAPKVFIIDEFGVWPYDRQAATALFALISAR